MATTQAAMEEMEPLNAHMHRVWMADLTLKQDRVESLYAQGGWVFMVSENNEVYALSRYGGTLEWAVRVGEKYTTVLPPLVMADRIAFPVNTRLFIYDFHGILDRAQDVGFAMHAPGVSDGKTTIYIPAAKEARDNSGGARVAAVDTTKQVGEVIWEFLTRGPITSAPTLYNNVIYVGGGDNRVYAVSTRCEPMWPLDKYSFVTAGRIEADVQVDEYGVYAASTDTKLYALDRNTGKIKWMYYGESALSTPPMVTADTVYQYSAGKGLAAIDKLHGTLDRSAKWVQPEAVQVLSVGTRGVYVRLSDNTIGGLDKQTGAVMWRGARKYSQFVTNKKDGMIFVTTEEGRVYGYLPAGEMATTRPAMVMPAKAAGTGAAATKPMMQVKPASPATPAVQ
jgi:outer membrane protein assembly factor BamB